LPYSGHNLRSGFQKNESTPLIVTIHTFITTMQARKNILLSAALIAAVVLPGAANAQAVDFTWYGRIDMALENNKDGTLSRTMFQNFASRLGIKGERKFGADLSGIFQVETGVAPDDTANSKAFANRNSFIGLKSASAGTVLLGTYDMPLKALEGTAYGLWAEGDLQEILINGKATAATIGSSFGNLHTRQKNVLAYTSPKLMNAVVTKLAYSPDEGKIAAVPATATIAASPSIAKPVFGMSAEYDDGTWNAGLATQSQKNFGAVAATATAPASNLGHTLKGTKLTAGAKMGAWTVGVAYSKLDNSNGVKPTNYLLTGTYALDSTITLKASLGKAGQTASGKNDSTRGLALEGDYALDKQTTAYAYYTSLTNSTNGKARFEGSDSQFNSAAGKDPRALGVGVRYSF
jgi:predicted porin